MFTGIVLGLGRVAGHPEAVPGGGLRVVIEPSAELAARLELGASLAVSGVCLTVARRDVDNGAVGRVGLDLSPETLARTTLGALRAGDHVNLELPLRASDWLGGHLVQGHVDTTITVLGRREQGEHRELELALPAEMGEYVVEKGSLALDGVSLTVAGASGDRFRVALIPHTLAITTLGERRVGDRLNLEVDVMAKYAARAVARYLERAPAG